MSKRHTPPRLNRRSVLLAAAGVPLAGVALGPARAHGAMAADDDGAINDFQFDVRAKPGLFDHGLGQTDAA
jgi:hypothetical protein